MVLRRVLGFGRFFLAVRPSLLASSLAFQATLSLLPLSLLTLLLLSRGEGWTAPAIIGVLSALFPRAGAESLHQLLAALRQQATGFGLLGLLTLWWSGSWFFASLEIALAAINHLPPRPFWAQKLSSLFFTAIFALFIWAASLFALAVARIPTGPPPLSVPPAHLAGGLNLVLGVLFFAGIYALLPSRRQPLSRVWPGAVLAGLLYQVLSALFGVYLGMAHLTWYGAFSLVFVLLLWFYLLGEILLLGAAFNAFYFRQQGS